MYNEISLSVLVQGNIDNSGEWCKLIFSSTMGVIDNEEWDNIIFSSSRGDIQ